MRRGPLALVLAVAAAAGTTGAAYAAFPYPKSSGNPNDYTQYRLPSGANKGPNDLQGGLVWKYAATPEEGNEPVNSMDRELRGVRGAHVADNADVDTAWRTTTGRPDVAIAVLDSGIKWNDRDAMEDLRKKTRLNKGELPRPRHNRSESLEDKEDCSKYTRAYDANGDGVFNVVDYSCDSRVERDLHKRKPRGVGPIRLLDPQDVLIAFSDKRDKDRNGFVDDIVGWDFMDNDNDPFDDVQYGHGTGEAEDSTGEADNGHGLGSCPNCMAVHLRVGDSFIADESRFGQAVIYAVDNGVSVVQEALGTLNHTRLARQAVEYAYRHGVAIIASAADEAAQHHNWPSSEPHVIVVNSIRNYDETFTPQPRSYLQFNGCTNFSSKITASVPSTSCSSEATGRGAGYAGLIYSAALNAREKGTIGDHPRCRRADGKPCVITANEVRQLMASGTVGGRGLSDDVDFAAKPETSCEQSRQPSCADPNKNAFGNNLVVSPLVTTKRYPARKGHDQFYGWGRVNVNSGVDALSAARIPPEVEITAPDWYAQVDPRKATEEIRGQVATRGAAYRCRVLVAPGSYPNNDSTADSPPGDFKPVPSPWCDGSLRSQAYDGKLADLDLNELKSRFPPNAGSFDGREPGTGGQTANGRPNVDAYGFVVKVVATVGSGDSQLTGEDRRNLYLHHDRDLLPAFPIQLESDGESSPLFVDLNGDNRNELVFGTADGGVHAMRPDGSELRGWPTRGDRLPLHRRGRAFRKRAVSRNAAGAFLASLAAGDLNRDGSPEVVGADFEGKLYVWNARGRRLFKREAKTRWGGKPKRPFVDSRNGKRNRTQHGFIGSPVLADIDGNDGGKLEIVAANMDRHVYVWNDNGKRLRGFPVLVVDWSKVEKVNRRTHQVKFKKSAGDALNQGAIVDTPAVGDITGDGRPEIVVGTNEEYAVDAPGEGPFNAGGVNVASLGAIAQTGALTLAHSRLYAIRPEGDRDGLIRGSAPYLRGWPVKIGLILAELLPIVGEGMTGAPVIGPVDCPSGGGGPKVGAIPDAGPGYVLNPSGDSCYGKDGGKDVVLQTDGSGNPGHTDTPGFPAVGHPAFGNVGGGISFLAPMAGLQRALDVAVNEYQGGQDLAGVWNASSGRFRSGFPGVVNDLQFLTGPSVADIDGDESEDVLTGTAYLDLAAFSGSGAPVSDAWPKLTSDWMVANPLIGSFGTLDTASDSRKVVVAMTRSGRILAYKTDAPPCTPGSWPRFHHDNANSGDYSRDAVAPGRPAGPSIADGKLRFGAPGDDLLCGKVARYEVGQSSRRITSRSFRKARKIDVSATPGEAGSSESIALPSTLKRYVAVRAVDEQGNVGPVAVVKSG